MAKLDEVRNITRMDYPDRKRLSKGWWVRVMRNNKTFSRFFNDNKYDGRDKALEKAKQYRDKMEQENEGFVGLGYHPFKSQRNTSGIVGIHKRQSTNVRKSGKIYTYYFWCAQWRNLSGKRVTKSFSISKYGEAEALRLALEAREEAIATLAGIKKPIITSWGKLPLTKLIEVVETTQSTYDKGRALEELIAHLFQTFPGFSISQRNASTETEEIDIILLNASTDPRFQRESAILLVECKNWSSKCGKNEFVIFKEKIENRSSRCTLGFLVSWNGFAQTVTKEMLRGSREQTLIIPLEGKDIKKAVRENNFEQILTEAWHSAVTI